MKLFRTGQSYTVNDRRNIQVEYPIVKGKDRSKISSHGETTQFPKMDA